MIAALVLTYNRRHHLQRWLQCIERQTVAPDLLIVVDNGSTDGTAEWVEAEHPEVTLLALPKNLGPSAAAAIGMRRAYELGADWIWMFDDDAFPAPTALERALATADAVNDARLGMVWLPFDDFGGWMWRGRKIPVSVRSESDEYQHPFRVDQVDLNMTLVSRKVVERVGVPRDDFFIMLWSCDYCLRAAEAGFSIWVVPEILVTHEHAGSTDTGIWRSYYQTRNQLWMALERRSPRELFWWLVRQCRFTAGTLLRHDQKWRRLSLRARGTWDALTGRMGKVVAPTDNQPADLS